MRQTIFSLILCCSFILSGWAQSNPIDVFQSTTPNTPEFYGNGALHFLVEGDNLMLRGSFEPAILAYDNAIVLEPYFAEAYIKRAMAKMRLGRRTAAKNDYQKALKLNPYAADLHGFNGNLHRRAILAYEEGKPDGRTGWDYINEFYNQPFGQKEEADDDEYTAYLELLAQAIDLKLKGELLEAKLMLDDALAAGGDQDPFVLKWRGNIYLLLGEYFPAIDDYTKAIQLDGTYSEAYFNRGVAFLLANNRSDACTNLEESVRLGYEEGEERMQYFCGF